MTGKVKFIATLIAIFCFFLLFQIVLYLTHSNVNRSQSSLMNQYYRLWQKNPEAAKHTLDILIQQYPDDQSAQRELAYWYLRAGDITHAIPAFVRAHQLNPDDNAIAIDLSRLYLENKQPAKAIALLQSLKPIANETRANQVQHLLADAILLAKLPKATRTKQTPVPDLAQSMSPTIMVTPAALSISKQPQQTPLFPNGLGGRMTWFVPSYSQAMTTPTIPAKASLTQAASHAASQRMSARDKLMNEYYQLKKNQPKLAWAKLQIILLRYPYYEQALKEAGYYALLTLKNNRLAKSYFVRVYALDPDPDIARQLGYICDNLRQKREAYYYFDLARSAKKLKDRLTAEIAKTNLRGMQTKFLPDPYFATLDFSPLYMSRFKLLIYPTIFHIGRIMNERFNWKLYLSYRRTNDDKSTTTNLISNIFEDDAAIIAIGTQFTPLPILPQLIALIEVGKSKDLIYRNRSRLRNDIRYGFAFYYEWGRPAQYTFQPKLMFQFNGDIYSDAIYYNRYHDAIGTLRIRPGFKVFRYGSTTLNIYYKSFVVEDEARLFYNNILETGPGIALTLSDRYNIILRCEMLHGQYLPAGSPTPNPYSLNYHNTLTELDTYFEF